MNTIERAKLTLERYHNNQNLLMTKDGQAAVAQALLDAVEVLEFYADPETWGDDDWQIKSVNVAEYAESGAKARALLTRVSK